MKKFLITALLLCSASGLFAQKYMTRTARITFDATAPNSPEKIEAVNNEVANILDGQSGSVVFQVLLNSFKFQRELMKEHFNEKYVESDKFPKATFDGKLTNVSAVNFSKDGTYNVTAAGKLTIHGVTQEVSVPGTVEVKGASVRLKAKFVIELKDYKVQVPSMVADKVSKQASIMLDSELTKK
jgi:hypothetical protein